MDSQTSSFPTLYNTDKNGKTRCWILNVEDENVIREYGQVGGKLIKVSRKYTGKNIGKKNESSPEEQARFEAQKLWSAQLKKDYKPSEDDTTGTEFFDTVMEKINSQGGNLHNIRATKNEVSVSSSKGTIKRTKVYIPMKAEKFDDYWEKHQNGKASNPLHFDPEDCYIQPKLDGTRGMAYLGEDNETHITSRTGKETVYLTEIKQEIKEKLLSSPKHAKCILDGEFYVHTILDQNNNPMDSPDRFRIISGSCRSKRNRPSEHENLIEFHIFDMIDPDNTTATFKERHEFLLELFSDNTENKKLVVVDTKMLSSPTKSELWKLHDEFVENRYEGAMLRDKSGVYTDKRTPKLLKMKPEYDAEFKIVGAKSGEGTEEGCVVYELETEKGYKFTCRPKGTFEDRKKALKEIEKDIGKQYTVVYQEMDKKTGIPIHIRGKGIRYD